MLGLKPFARIDIDSQIVQQLKNSCLKGVINNISTVEAGNSFHKKGNLYRVNKNGTVN